MVAHHREVAGGEFPARDPDAVWRMRRAQYVAWLETGAFVFLVPGEGAEQAPPGYAFLRVGAPSPTWDLGEPVAAAARRRGISTELIAHGRELLRELGARRWNVTVVAATERVVEL